jgi:hypothetical protein
MIEKLHFLAEAASGVNNLTGEPTDKAWQGFLERYNPLSIFDWCCRHDSTSFPGARKCYNIYVITRADAFAAWALKGLPGEKSIGVTQDKCG